MISELDPVPMTSVSASLTSPDILLHVLHHLFVVNDYPSILSCALVNRAFNACSKTYLYRHVAFIGGGGRRRALKFRRIPSRQSNLRIDAERHLRSSLLPENAPYVKHLYVSELAFPQVYEAIQTFPSLRSLSLSPEVSDDVKTFLSLLANSPQVTNDTLSVLEVWEACFAEPEYGLPSAIGGIHSIAEEDEASEVQDTVQRDKSSAELLMDIAPTSLESLIIHNPKTILLSNLSTWINKLGTLKRISLIDNAGPVTPTMLSSLVSTLSAVRIQELALGLSYSLTDTNLFMALNQLQELKELTVTYYLQLNVPAVTPSLAHLRALRIIHTGPPISTVREANFFSNDNFGNRTSRSRSWQVEHQAVTTAGGAIVEIEASPGESDRG
ncbi:hypothetical protein NEOLEDRAFT_1148317 [Neolentinus lepideus HHB14362 ss-1]|uniref:F-box domain-containing protein n=1 Tax=Neolentinus lepideus HHB14362 ss-1 TaxID=1314782 RepID=A0A165SFI8_9AGAM|nr:hypothetical protein NEOLEDRAFT_1148317 [Neolentinus lepideus HHB14362 ss-1]